MRQNKYYYRNVYFIFELHVSTTIFQNKPLLKALWNFKFKLILLNTQVIKMVEKKSDSFSAKFREEGNSSFQQRDYFKSLTLFNKVMKNLLDLFSINFVTF